MDSWISGHGAAGGAVAVAMYDDHLEVVNPGSLHFGITPKKLTRPHESKPWNAIIANVFYRAGIIERWGSGTLNVIDWCVENDNPKPTWQEQAGSVYITFLPAVLPAPKTPDQTMKRGSTTEVAMEVTPEVKLIKSLIGEMSRQQLQEASRLRNDEHFRKAYLPPALEAGLIEMTIPGKPHSSKQRYKLTEKGEQVLKSGRGK